MTPRVSVVLPVRDASPTLEEALRSILQQSFADIEVLAVNDGSHDDSGRLLDAAARGDTRLRVLHTPRWGLVPALNAALRLARAPLLARMDADDVAHPNRLELQLERLAREPGLDVLGSRVELLSGPGAPPAGMLDYVAWQNELLDHDAIVQDLFVESPLVHPSVMLRTALLRRLSGYRETGGPEDYDLWLRAAAAGARFAKSPETLLGWRDGATRLTRHDPRYAPERFFARKLEALCQGPLAQPEPVVIWGAGAIGKAWGRALLSRGHRLSAFVEVSPQKVGKRIHGAPVVAVSGAAPFREAWHLAAVGQRGARERIRSAARALGVPISRLLAVA